jgi:mannose-1-phosphate guanylyltransferase
LTKLQIEEINIRDVEYILEPIRRDTAPAITIACLGLNNEDIVLVTPSDHYINNKEKYKESIENAKILADNEYLVTFGVKPSYPETGFGYIEAEGENVISFKEKPSKKTAEKYLNAGNYNWNSGMLMFKVKTYFEEIKIHSKNILTASQKVFKEKELDGNVTKIKKRLMEKIPAISVDYAVMEKSKKIKMVNLNANWSDLGSFEAIYNILGHDNHGNVSSSGNILLGSKNNFIISSDKPIALIDVNDLVVVDTNDAILISKKGYSHKIKEIIQELEKIKPNITKINKGQHPPC